MVENLRLGVNFIFFWKSFLVILLLITRGLKALSIIIQIPSILCWAVTIFEKKKKKKSWKFKYWKFSKFLNKLDFSNLQMQVHHRHIAGDSSPFLHTKQRWSCSTSKPGWFANSFYIYCEICYKTKLVLCRVNYGHPSSHNK